MSDRIPGSSWSNPIWYGEYRIYTASADARAFGGYSYEFVHDDYDPTPNNPGEGPGDHRAGHAKSIDEARREIDDIEEDAKTGGVATAQKPRDGQL
jgi:hypothetical protein